MPRLLRHGVAWTILLGVALALVVLYVPRLLIPGPVTTGHAKLENDCFACHRPFLGPRPALCTGCHPAAKIAPARPAVAAFHGEPLAQDCLACHTDHQGRDPARATARFDHRVLASGVAADCQACHAKPGDALHARITMGCAQCHATAGWRPATYDHTASFRFDRHHPADCETCHTGASFASYTCTECHEHAPDRIRRKHLKEGINDYEPCAVCHRSGSEKEAKRLWRDLQRRGLTPSEAARTRSAGAYGSPTLPAPPPTPGMRQGNRAPGEHHDDEEHHEDKKHHDDEEHHGRKHD